MQSRVDKVGNGFNTGASEEWKRFDNDTVRKGMGSQEMKKNCQASLEDLVDLVLVCTLK